MISNTEHPRRKHVACGETREQLLADIRETFGDLSAMLWPDDLKRVFTWLKQERADWDAGRRAYEVPSDVKAAFMEVRGVVLAHLAKAKAYQRRQFDLGI